MVRDPGFTGVDWYARTTERLAGDLLGGAGPQPLSTAAQETARLASAYGAAATHLDALVVRLDAAVDTGLPDGAVDTGRPDGAVDTGRPGGAVDTGRPGGTRRTGPLPDYARWLARHAADLAEYAAKLSAQASAYEVAAHAMPAPAEATRMRLDRENAQAAAAAGGTEPAAAALIGAAADSERAEQQAHGDAAAIMVGFERAAEPLRVAWEFTPPPKNRTGTNKDTKDRSRGRGTAGKTGGGGAGVPAAPLSAFPVTALQRDQNAAATRPAASTASSGTGMRGMPMMPAGMMGAAGAGAALRNANHTPGATATDPDSDDAAEAFIVHAAPSVLGDHGDTALEQA